MKNKRSHTNVLYVIVLLLGVLSFPVRCLGSEHCTAFEFQDEVPDTKQLELPSGSNVTIQFRLELSGCSERIINSASMITVSKSETKTTPNIHKDICRWKLQQGQCTVSFQRTCLCPDEEGLYSFVTTVQSSDQGKRWIWKLTLSQSESLDREMKMKINDAIERMNITGLTLRPSHRVTSGSSVDVLCTFKGGRRSEKPVLRTSGKLLAQAGIKAEKGEWLHRLNNVSCEDSGPISCHPPGLQSLDLSVQLLVACPPEFVTRTGQFNLDPRKATTLQFPLKLFDTSTPNCTISIVDDAGGQSLNGTAGTALRSQSCSGFFSNVQLSGETPNRLLTLSSPKFVSFQDLGLWNLTLANDAGSDTVTFTLRLLNQSESTDSVNPQTISTGIIVITVVVTLVVVAVIISVVIIVLVMRKARRTKRRPSIRHLIRAASRAIHSTHIYDDLGAGPGNRKTMSRTSRGRDSQGEGELYEMPGNLYEIPDAAAPPPPPLPLKPRSLSPPLPAAVTKTTTTASSEFPPPPSPEVLALYGKRLEPSVPLLPAGSTSPHQPPPSPQLSLSSTLSRGSRGRLLPSDHDRASGVASGSGSGPGSATGPKGRGPFRLQLPSFGARAKKDQDLTSSYC